MKTIRALFTREWLTFWLTPTPYISCIALLAASGYFLGGYLNSFTERVEQYRAGFLPGSEVPNLTQWVIEPYCETLAFFLLLIVPICTSRVFAEEKLSGNLQMILAAPVKPIQLVLAKYLALLFSVVCLLAFLLMPAALLLSLTGAGMSPLLWGGISLVLLASFYIALGCAVSQSVSQPVASALIHLSLLLILYFIHAAAGVIPVLEYSLAEFFSPVMHSKRILQGLFSSTDIGFFIAATIGALTYTTVHLAREART